MVNREQVPLPSTRPVNALRCFAAEATMAETFNCIEILANKCVAKFVNKSTSQPTCYVLLTIFLFVRIYAWDPRCIKRWYGRFARTYVCASIEIRNALKCSPVFHEASPYPSSATSHATKVTMISSISRKQYALALFAVDVIFWYNFRKILLDKFSLTSFFITQIRKSIIFYFYTWNCYFYYLWNNNVLKINEDTWSFNVSNSRMGNNILWVTFNYLM